MDTGLIPKYVSRQVLLVMILLSFAILCVGCSEPYNVADAWLCPDPSFSLIYSKDDLWHYLQSSKKTVVMYGMVNDELMQVDVLFSRATFCIYPEGSHSYSDRLLTGTWKYRNNTLVLSIEDDYLFDNKYSELVFTSSKQE